MNKLIDTYAFDAVVLQNSDLPQAALKLGQCLLYDFTKTNHEWVVTNSRIL